MENWTTNFVGCWRHVAGNSNGNDAAVPYSVLQSRSLVTDTCPCAVGHSTLRAAVSPRVLLLCQAWAGRGRETLKMDDGVCHVSGKRQRCSRAVLCAAV
eukprot:gene23286-35383_t